MVPEKHKTEDTNKYFIGLQNNRHPSQLHGWQRL
jgi:hypothetical protein